MLVFTFCNVCFGGAAIYNAMMARRADNVKDAYLHGKASRRCAYIGVFVTVGMVALFFIMYKLKTQDIQKIFDSFSAAMFGGQETGETGL